MVIPNRCILVAVIVTIANILVNGINPLVESIAVPEIQAFNNIDKTGSHPYGFVGFARFNSNIGCIINGVEGSVETTHWIAVIQVNLTSICSGVTQTAV